jgi:hypothetical protein
MTGDRFESTLRAWLADRAPAGASPSLSARIAAVPAETASSRRSAIGRPVRWVASMGLAASFVVALAWVATRGVLVRPGNGSVGATPSLPPLDPTAIGVGVVAAPGVSWLPVLVIGAVVVGFAVVIWRTRKRWVRALAGGTLVVVLAVVSTISNSSWIGFGPTGAWAAGLGFDHWGTETQSVAGSDHAFFHLRPGEPFTFSFTLTNHAPIPITIQGMIQDPPNAGFQLTGLGLQRPVPGVEPDGWPVSGLPADNVAFTPVRIEPSAYRLIVVTGKAGPCAGGWEDAANATSMSTNVVTLAYSSLGLERTEQVLLPLTVEIPVVQGCSG